MTADQDKSIKTLVEQRVPGKSLDAAFYTSADVFQVDMREIFGKHWIFVAVEPEVAEPGDALVVNVGPSSVILVRDDNGEIRAFHNVCRHRGARMIPEGATMIGNIVCPYHSWTYGLDGKLKFYEHMGETFKPGCNSLKPVALRSVGGLVFICLSDNPPTDIDDMARVMEPYLAPHNLREARIAHQADLIEEGNWKLTMENNRECYHCGPNHPELTIPLFAYGFGFSPTELDEQGKAEAQRYTDLVDASCSRWEGAGIPSREVDELTGRATGFRTQRLPIDQSGESYTMDTRAACRLPVGAVQDKALGALSFWTQPNSWHHFMGDHVITFTALPLSANRTLVRTTWLVNKDAVEGVDYDLERLTEVWKATNQQDADLVAIAQQGAEDPAYEPGFYSPYTEGLVEKFAAWYIERLKDSLA